MLVLTRKATERIQIGDNVVVTILDIRGNKVRIGIDAPKEIRILRTELQGRTELRNVITEAERKTSLAIAALARPQDPGRIQAWETEGGACS